jgi:hypothetical protein
MKFENSWIKKGLLLAAGTLCLEFAVSTSAQVQTNTTTTAGQSSQVVKVERGEVVTVEGNELIVKMEDGSIQHFPNIPETVKITVDGIQLGIHDLKPGMKLQRTITTTTTPQTITTIQTVTGKVWHISPPISVILTLENGTNQQFTIPKDQKFNVDGKMVDAFGLKKGMQISATKIVEVPMVVAKQQKSVTGTMPPPAPAQLVNAPLLIAEGEPTPTQAETETPAAPANPIPTTGGYLHWIGLLVLLLVTVWIAAKSIRAKNRT